MQTRLRRARPDDTAAQHRARVALKQYRYLVETLAAARGEPPAPLLRQLQRAQSALGALHDFELLRRRLEKFAARHGPAADWLRARLATLARHHQALIRARPAFLAGMTAFRPLAFPRKQKPRAGAVAP
jgi:CHAD domain-containing protein